jgi:hypothetical protein
MPRFGRTLLVLVMLLLHVVTVDEIVNHVRCHMWAKGLGQSKSGCGSVKAWNAQGSDKVSQQSRSTTGIEVCE